jgi:hypothetical protein
MKEPRKISIDPNDPEQRDMVTKIIEGFLEMPQHHQAMLNAFLEKALAGDEEANQLSEDYNTGKLTKVELWEEMHRRYGGKDPDELVA